MRKCCATANPNTKDIHCTRVTDHGPPNKYAVHVFQGTACPIVGSLPLASSPLVLVGWGSHHYKTARKTTKPRQAYIAIGLYAILYGKTHVVFKANVALFFVCGH